MNKIAIIAASALLAGTYAVALAGSKGVSTLSPGHQMQTSPTPTTKGASDLTPADQKRESITPTTKGASDFTPPDARKDRRGK
jgi:hypothetical protein